MKGMVVINEEYDCKIRRGIGVKIISYDIRRDLRV